MTLTDPENESDDGEFGDEMVGPSDDELDELADEGVDRDDS
jgi:hypothetical protein